MSILQLSEVDIVEVVEVEDDDGEDPRLVVDMGYRALDGAEAGVALGPIGGGMASGAAPLVTRVTGLDEPMDPFVRKLLEVVEELLDGEPLYLRWRGAYLDALLPNPPEKESRWWCRYVMCLCMVVSCCSCRYCTQRGHSFCSRDLMVHFRDVHHARVPDDQVLRDYVFYRDGAGRAPGQADREMVTVAFNQCGLGRVPVSVPLYPFMQIGDEILRIYR